MSRCPYHTHRSVTNLKYHLTLKITAIFFYREKLILCKNMTDASLEAIGKVLGGRDHSTVVHGIKKVAEDVSADEAVAKTVETIKKKINPN